MAVATGFTADRMLAIEQSCIKSGAVDLNGNLQLETVGGDFVNAGYVVGPKGDKGNTGAKGADATLEPFSLTTEDLNTIVEPSYGVQIMNANATTARNYPAARAGWLEVSASPTRHMIHQRYTDYQGQRIWIRERYNNVWNGWYLVFRAPSSGYTVTPATGWAITVYSFLTVGLNGWIDLGIERTGGNIANVTSGNITNQVVGTIANQDMWPASSVGPSLATTTTGYVLAGYIDSAGQIVISALGPSATDVPNINTGNNFRVSGTWPLKEIVPPL